MEKRKFYPPIWTMTPSSFDAARQWYVHDKKVKEIILNNALLQNYRVSELHLNLTQLFVVDAQGNEHAVVDFPGQNSVTIKGMSTGHFLKSANTVSLHSGIYTSLRLYFEKNTTKFKHNDGSVESVSNLDYLDFTMEKELRLSKGEQTAIKLWFNLAPIKAKSPFSSFSGWIKKKKRQLPRLAGSMG